MQYVRVPWGQWYEQAYRTLTFPQDWDVRLCAMAHRDALTDQQIVQKLQNPIGTPPLSALAAGKDSACIVVDDISRPTPCRTLLPLVIDMLTGAGMGYDQIAVLIALGGHRPMTKQEMRIKVGDWVLNRVAVYNHSPFAHDLVELPEDGQVIKVNRHYAAAQLRIAIGCVVPHTLAGFSGGAKAVVPGIGGIETLRENHTLVFDDKAGGMSFKTSTCDPDNAMRRNMEQVVGRVGLDFILNVVVNDDMQVADAFAGHFVKAHRAACRRATELLRTELVPGADIVVLSAFPKDTEYSQIGTCFAVLGQHKAACVAPGGTLVAMTAASEGAGFHALFGPGMSLFSPHDDNVPPPQLRGIDTLIYSDGASAIDVRQFYRGQPPAVYGKWDQVMDKLCQKYAGRRPVVAVYPMGAIQIGHMAREEGNGA